MKSIQEWINDIHKEAKIRGFHDGPIDISEQLCLIHSEVSEALEEDRIADQSVVPSFAFEEELADIVIRVFDLCGALSINLEDVIRLKHAKNKTRPRLHGKRY